MAKVKTEQEMFPLVESWFASGLTQKQFCTTHQYPIHILAYWIGRYRKAQANKAATNKAETTSGKAAKKAVAADSSSGFIRLSSPAPTPTPAPAPIGSMEVVLPTRCHYPLFYHCSSRLSQRIALSMFALNASQRFFLYSMPVDMRKSFDALSGIVCGTMGKDALSGDVYIFVDKSRDKIKLLVWEKGGFVLYYKRLESGIFHLPKLQEDGLSHSELCLLIEGVEVEVTHRHKRYVRPQEKIIAPA